MAKVHYAFGPYKVPVCRVTMRDWDTSEEVDVVTCLTCIRMLQVRGQLDGEPKRMGRPPADPSPKVPMAGLSLPADAVMLSNHLMARANLFYYNVKSRKHPDIMTDRVSLPIASDSIKALALAVAEYITFNLVRR